MSNGPCVSNAGPLIHLARGLGLEVIGSIGVLLRAFKRGLVSRKDALGKLNKLSRTMWLSSEAYGRL
jgi:predicted nucleic acid-binding protein